MCECEYALRIPGASLQIETRAIAILARITGDREKARLLMEESYSGDWPSLMSDCKQLSYAFPELRFELEELLTDASSNNWWRTYWFFEDGELLP